MSVSGSVATPEEQFILKTKSETVPRTDRPRVLLSTRQASAYRVLSIQQSTFVGGVGRGFSFMNRRKASPPPKKLRWPLFHGTSLQEMGVGLG